MITSSAPVHPPGKPPRPTLHAAVFLLIFAPFWLAPHWLNLGPAVLIAILMAVTWFFLRREKRSLAVLGLNASWRTMGLLLAGLLGGTLLMMVAALGVGLLLPFPWARNPLFSPTAAALSLMAFLSGNAVEELIFRGYSFERLIASIGHWKAQLVTALLFALFHIAQGWPWQVALLGTTIGSLLFGMVFVCWRSVPAAIGVHAAGNWTRELLLEDPPRAQTFFAPLSPRPWTPGEAVAASAIFSGIMLIAGVVLWRQYARRIDRR